MSKPGKIKKPSRQELEGQIKELKSQLVHQYHFASVGIQKAGKEFTASAVILELTALGGRKLVEPVAIKDGLSEESIAALLKDLERSYKLAIAWTP